MERTVLWKIGGEAGFGIMSTGLMLAKVATRLGYHMFDYSEYPSLIRGGHNTYEVHIADDVIGSSKKEIDMLVCLNEETYTLHKGRLQDSSYVMYDPEKMKLESSIGKVIEVPVTSILTNAGALPVMANMVFFGASLGLWNVPQIVWEGVIQDVFGKKNEKMIEDNIAMAKTGYDYVQQQYASLIGEVLPEKQDKEALMVLSGNEAFGFGSVVADCRLYAAYPMTPASTVLSYLAATAKDTGMVVRHSEDEIAAINTALGAAYAGVRAGTGSSGGGFALMVETLSYAGVAEIPLVVFLAQRPGPATGMPTWTGQGDLLFTVYAGHGEFPKIVLAPGDATEMIALAAKAYDLADMYQTPVLVLSDKVLSESRQDVSLPWTEKLIETYQPNRGKIITKASEDYQRYTLSDDGISPMLIPGQEGLYYQANSYEHVADGHATEDMQIRIQQADKRKKKIDAYFEHDFATPEVFGDLEMAETVFVSWGGNKGVIVDALHSLKAQGKQVAYIHFTHVYPLRRDKVEDYLGLQGKRYVLIENNQMAQFGQILKSETGFDIEEKFLKYDGQPIFIEEIVQLVLR